MGKPARHAGEMSRNVAKQKVYDRDVGELANEGLPWKKKDFDQFITVWTDNLPEREVCKVLGRSWKSIDTIRWKIPSKKYTKGYVPENQIDRTFKVWNQRELWFLRTCVKYSWSTTEIARSTGRSKEAVQSKIEELQQASRPTLL